MPRTPRGPRYPSNCDEQEPLVDHHRRRFAGPRRLVGRTARNGHEKESPYRFATVERGDIEATVSATGTLGRRDHGPGRHPGVRSGLGDLRRLQRPGEEGPAPRAHRSDAAAAGGARTRRPASSAPRRSSTPPSASTTATRSCSSEKLIPESEITNYQSTYDVAQGQREVGARRARSRQAQPRLHRDLLADRRRRRRAQRRRRSDRRRQPVGAAALPHRQRPVADADPGLGGRERHRRRSSKGRTCASPCRPIPTSTSPARCSRCGCSRRRSRTSSTTRSSSRSRTRTAGCFPA